jgi:hypothetical protein
VGLSDDERAALEKAVAESGYVRETKSAINARYKLGLGSFLKELAGIAAVGQHKEGQDLDVTIRAAAAASCQSVGEWIRTVALASIGYTPLESQLEIARRAWEAGPDKWVDHPGADEDIDPLPRPKQKKATQATKTKPKS